MPVQNNTHSPIHATASEAENEFNNTIYLLYMLLDRDNKDKGYQDALKDPSKENLDLNKKLLKHEVKRYISKVKVYYEAMKGELRGSIDSYARKGLVDYYDTSLAGENMAEKLMQKVTEIEKDTDMDIGDSAGFILSYEIGFKNGVAAKSPLSTIIKTKLK